MSIWYKFFLFRLSVLIDILLWGTCVTRVRMWTDSHKSVATWIYLTYDRLVSSTLQSFDAHHWNGGASQCIQRVIVCLHCWLLQVVELIVYWHAVISLCTDTSVAASDVASGSFGTPDSSENVSSLADIDKASTPRSATSESTASAPSSAVNVGAISSAEAIGNGSDATANGEATAITNICDGPVEACFSPSATSRDTCYCSLGKFPEGVWNVNVDCSLSDWKFVPISTNTQALLW